MWWVSQLWKRIKKPCINKQTFGWYHPLLIIIQTSYFGSSLQNKKTCIISFIIWFSREFCEYMYFVLVESHYAFCASKCMSTGIFCYPTDVAFQCLVCLRHSTQKSHMFSRDFILFSGRLNQTTALYPIQKHLAIDRAYKNVPITQK